MACLKGSLCCHLSVPEGLELHSGHVQVARLALGNHICAAASLFPHCRHVGSICFASAGRA